MSLVIIVPAIVFLVVGLIAFFFYNSFDVVENMRGRMGNYHMNEVNRTSYSILLFLGRIGYAICVGFAWAMSAFCLFSIINEPVRRDFSLRFKGTLVVGILYVPLFYVGWYMLRDAETPFVRALSSLWIPLLVLVVAFVFFLLCEKLKWLSDMLKSFFSKSVKKK